MIVIKTEEKVTENFTFKKIVDFKILRMDLLPRAYLTSKKPIAYKTLSGALFLRNKKSTVRYLMKGDYLLKEDFINILKTLKQAGKNLKKINKEFQEIKKEEFRI